ncbi:hypothetical protein KM043_007533 [Ampulex compressa]|nr:hypothetical protein KM043_007533 [Ampulex compressa]
MKTSKTKSLENDSQKFLVHSFAASSAKEEQKEEEMERRNRKRGGKWAENKKKERNDGKKEMERTGREEGPGSNCPRRCRSPRRHAMGHRMLFGLTSSTFPRPNYGLVGRFGSSGAEISFNRPPRSGHFYSIEENVPMANPDLIDGDSPPDNVKSMEIINVTVIGHFPRRSFAD